jgi:hypothetical protein
MYRFDRAQDVDVSDAFAFGIYTILDVRACGDGAI